MNGKEPCMHKLHFRLETVTWRLQGNQKCQVHVSKYRLGGVVVSVLVTGPKVCGFEPGQGDGFLRAIKIRITPSFGWEVKPEVTCKILRHMGMDRLNSHFLRPSPNCSRDVSGDGQSALVDKLGFSPSRYHLPRSTSLSPGDSTTGPRPQCLDGSLTPSQQPIYNLHASKTVTAKLWPLKVLKYSCLFSWVINS
jgi:hypothetical protein